MALARSKGRVLAEVAGLTERFLPGQTEIGRPLVGRAKPGGADTKCGGAKPQGGTNAPPWGLEGMSGSRMCWMFNII